MMARHSLQRCHPRDLFARWGRLVAANWFWVPVLFIGLAQFYPAGLSSHAERSDERELCLDPVGDHLEAIGLKPLGGEIVPTGNEGTSERWLAGFAWIRPHDEQQDHDRCSGLSGLLGTPSPCAANLVGLGVRLQV